MKIGPIIKKMYTLQRENFILHSNMFSKIMLDLFKPEKSKRKILPIFTEKIRYYPSIFRVRTIPDLSLVALTTWSLFTTETLKKLSLLYQVQF